MTGDLVVLLSANCSPNGGWMRVGPLFFVHYSELILKVSNELSLLSLVIISFFWHSDSSRITPEKLCRGNWEVSVKGSLSFQIISGLIFVIFI